MKTFKLSLGAAGVAALLISALPVSQAEARPHGYDHGHGHRGHGYRHRHHYRPSYYGPRFYSPGFYGPAFYGPRLSLGFVTGALPFGYLSLAVGGDPYYYHSGYFYRPAPTGYVVVSAPLGASVVSLPASAVRVEISGRTYYQYADAYYEWNPAGGNYVVVPAPVQVAAAPVSQSGFAPGQVVDTLPTGYTAEVVNGVQYYRYGSDYFLPTQQDGREVYVVVRI